MVIIGTYWYLFKHFMVRLIPQAYLEVLKRRDFLLLILANFLFQTSTSFILLALIVSVFAQTGSNFGVSGVILSFALPGFLMIAFAGLAADLFDRKKVMIAANIVQALVVLGILSTLREVIASIAFSFAYFAANSFFLPASSAASAQLVRRSQLLASNSLFILSLAGGQLFGFFAASVIHFFWGNVWVLILCEAITILVIWLLLLLPKLYPGKSLEALVVRTIRQIKTSLTLIFSKKTMGIFFIIFSLMQGIIAFGVTLAPGFFDEVVGIAIDKSPLFIFPMIAVGVALGIIFVNNPKMRESVFVAAGFGLMGIGGFVLGAILQFGLVSGIYLLLPVGGFLTVVGFGVIVATIASRTVLQKNVANNFQGTVFGTAVVLASFLASLFSPAAAGLEALVGYNNILLFGGVIFVILAVLIARAGTKWKF